MESIANALPITLLIGLTLFFAFRPGRRTLRMAFSQALLVFIVGAWLIGLIGGLFVRDGK